MILIPGIASTYRGYALTLNTLAERFRTVVYDYPGEHPGDGARLGRITHDDLVDDLFGLIDHLNLGRVVPLRPLVRLDGHAPGAAPRAAAVPEGGRPGGVRPPPVHAGRAAGAARSAGCFPGTTARLPFRERVLTYNSQIEFPAIIADRWAYYLEQNGLTPIAALAHRLDLLARLDLRPILPEIPTEVLLLQGNEDRIVARRYFDELLRGPAERPRGRHAAGRPPAPLHPRRGAGPGRDRLVPPLRPGRLPERAAAEPASARGGSRAG